MSERRTFHLEIRLSALEMTVFLLSRAIGDQYVQKKPQLLRQKNGECVIVDGTRTLQLLYNLYYW